MCRVILFGIKENLESSRGFSVFGYEQEGTDMLLSIQLDESEINTLIDILEEDAHANFLSKHRRIVLRKMIELLTQQKNTVLINRLGLNKQ